MRKIYKSILRLREQEKQAKFREFSEAEAERREHQQMLDHQRRRLEEERSTRHDTIGMIVLNDYLNMQRHIEIKESEKKQEDLDKVAEMKRDEMKEAQIEFRVMEEVVSNIQKKEEEERDRKQSIFLDELGGIGWHRKNKKVKE
jgi:hypothetical protein